MGDKPNLNIKTRSKPDVVGSLVCLPHFILYLNLSPAILNLDCTFYSLLLRNFARFFYKNRISLINRVVVKILCTLVCLGLCWQVAARNVAQTDFGCMHERRGIVVDTASLLTLKDSTELPIDTLVSDTVKADSLNVVQKRKSDFKHPIDFSSTDSIVLTGNGTILLYKDGMVVYHDSSPKKITANFISIDVDSNQLYSVGRLDSLGNTVEMSVFTDGGQSYEAKEINFNFKTEKGFIRGAKTQEGESYIIADKTKKTADGFFNMKDGKYTTCDNLDHPHFYMNLTKGRVKPGGYVTAGPAYMVVEDVPLPLAIPFGFFPFTSRYSSGIIMPSFGDELEAGFFLKNGGYYFAISDYFDLEVTGDIYTKGSWGVRAASTYRKRYAFSGNVNIQYNNIVRGEKDLPNYSLNKDFRINWQHRQDPKASAFSTFSASVDFFTSGYNRNSIDYVYNVAQQSQAETSSSVSFSHRLPSAPISFSATASASQNVRDSMLSLTMPTMRMDLSTIYPLRNKNRVGKERFYEKLSFSYSMEFSNSFRGKERHFAQSSLSKDWHNGILHSPKVQLPITLLKYITVSPQFTYTERWYFRKIEQSWDTPRQVVRYDTIGGFYRAYDFSTGLSVSTTMYGFYSPIKSIKDALGIGDIRHVFKPSVSFTYTPDFSEPKWNMYKVYTQELIDRNTGAVTLNDVKYSPYSSGKYGVPLAGRNNRLSISLDNNIEMKVKDRAASDTTDNIVYKKISIIDNFSLRGGYNFAADSLGMEDIAASVRIKITKNYSITLNTSFEVYMYGLNASGSPVRINRYRWDNGKLPWFTGSSMNFSYTLNNNTFASKSQKGRNGGNSNEQNQEHNPGENYNPDPSQNHQPDSTKQEKTKIENDMEGYQKPDFQWSLSFDAGIGWGRTMEFDYNKLEYKRDFNGGIVGLSGYINPSPNWQISYSASVALLKKLEITSLSLNLRRNLHCWSLTASVTPVGLYKSFMVTIGANASMLRDLKYDKRQKDNIEIR